MTEHPNARDLEKLQRLAERMDSAFRIPGTGIRVGFDSILGLIPGIGDAAALAPSAWIILESRRLGAPKDLLVRQGVNAGIDVVIGTIPLIGDLFDVGWKGNLRNVALLREHLETRHRDAPSPAPDAAGEGYLSSHHPTLAGKDQPQPTSSSPEKK